METYSSCSSDPSSSSSGSTLSSRGRTSACAPIRVICRVSAASRSASRAGPSTSTRLPGSTSSEYVHSNEASVSSRGSATGGGMLPSALGQHHVEQFPGAPAHRIGGREAGLLGHLIGGRAGGPLVQLVGLQRDADDPCRPDVRGDPRVVL